ncbi:MAG: hypothetical protein ABS46_01395 [Cytophagaceae bacterium SCN 52-12]|nr:MAG: hypothetical protein ABS46_01395 [Cytophagaceae bacterium SCN 52-12]
MLGKTSRPYFYWIYYFAKARIQNHGKMKKQFFRMLNKLNKALLPKLSKKDPVKLSKFERALAGFKYYVLINSLD